MVFMTLWTIPNNFCVGTLKVIASCDLCLYLQNDQKVNLWKKSTLTYKVASRLKRFGIWCWSLVINKPCVCDLPFDLCLYPKIWWPTFQVEGIDTGQTGGHRHMVYLWKMISMKLRIFWAYSQPCTSKLIFFKDWPFGHFQSIDRGQTFEPIWLKFFLHAPWTPESLNSKLQENSFKSTFHL